MEAQLRKLRLARGQYKGALNRIEKFINDEYSFSSSTIHKLEGRKEKLMSSFNEYESTQLDILELDEKDQEDVESTENRYFVVLSELNAQIKKCNVSEASSSYASSGPSKLPCVDIPIFNGKDFTEYTPFMELFKAVVHKNVSLSDVQRLFYLNKFLADEALSIIINLPLLNDSYKEALDLLEKRFNNKARLISSHINSILDMPTIQKGTAASIRSFISGLQQQLYALKKLQQPVEQWDMLLIAILTKKLDAYTNRAYHLDRNTDVLPTVSDFIRFLERRAIALEDSSTSNPTQCNEFENFASKVTNVAIMNLTTCLYCNETSHAIYACPKFKIAPIEDRLNFVSNKRLCTICLRKHDGRCKFNFSCRQCQAKYNTLLHNNQNTDVANNYSQTFDCTGLNQSQSKTMVNNFAIYNDNNLNNIKEQFRQAESIPKMRKNDIKKCLLPGHFIRGTPMIRFPDKVISDKYIKKHRSLKAYSKWKNNYPVYSGFDSEPRRQTLL